jgi:hypothetical protein
VEDARPALADLAALAVAVVVGTLLLNAITLLSA